MLAKRLVARCRPVAGGEPVLVRLCARYLLVEANGKRARDPVAHFHLSNGARVERINMLRRYLGKGRQGGGDLDGELPVRSGKIEDWHEDYAGEGKRNASSAVRRLIGGRQWSVVGLPAGSGAHNRDVALQAQSPELRTDLLHQFERKLLWLSSWMIHNANHIRPNRDGLKVGGHQASCASVISIMAALYFAVARPQDRIAVKPHAGPVFHAINYLFGRQTVDKMHGLRPFGGVQSYPSRVKDGPEVDFSTGSVGLGVAMTTFSALIQDYARLHGLGRTDLPAGRHIAIAGDAELDEGNIYEALLEGWKHDVRDVWWIIDYNRQSWIPSCPTGCSAGSRDCFATWAGTS